jgi:hypothetical protein
MPERTLPRRTGHIGLAKPERVVATGRQAGIAGQGAAPSAPPGSGTGRPPRRPAASTGWGPCPTRVLPAGTWRIMATLTAGAPRGWSSCASRSIPERAAATGSSCEDGSTRPNPAGQAGGQRHQHRGTERGDPLHNPPVAHHQPIPGSPGRTTDDHDNRTTPQPPRAPARARPAQAVPLRHRAGLGAPRPARPRDRRPQPPDRPPPGPMEDQAPVSQPTIDPNERKGNATPSHAHPGGHRGRRRAHSVRH